MGVCAIVALWSLHVVADPYGEFGTGLYLPLTPSPLDEKLLLIDDLPQHPHTVVIGSSRAHMFSPQDVENRTGKPAFNFALMLVHPHDMARIVDYLIASQPSVKEIILSVETTSLGFYQERRPETQNYERLEADGLRKNLAFPLLLRDTFSGTRLRDDLRVLQLSHVTGYPIARYATRADGLTLEVRDERLLATGKLNLSKEVAGDVRKLERNDIGNDTSNSREMAALVTSIRKALEHDITVRAFISPFHPTIIDTFAMTEGFQRLHRAGLDAITGLCGQEMHAFDFLDPASFGGEPDGFYDGWHMRATNTRPLIDALYDPSRDLCGVAATT